MSNTEDFPFEDVDRRKYGTEQIYKVRRFSGDIDPDSLVWHRDKEHRKVIVLLSNGWKFQFDEKLPFELKVGDSFEIQKDEYHRLIKGEGDLLLRIENLTRFPPHKYNIDGSPKDGTIIPRGKF